MESRHANRAVALISALALTCCSGASSDQSGDENKQRVGGCRIDTIPLGLSLEKTGAEAPCDRLTLKAVDDPGRETLKRAALELTALLDSMKVQILGRSELIRVMEGPCWPQFRIVIEVDLVSEEKSGKVREAMLSGRLAGISPSRERGEDYGDFFVTAGRGSSDWWTLWYRE